MKYALLLALLPLGLLAQFSWTDSFNDSNYTQNPVWAGSDSIFIVNTAKQLQLNANSAGSAHLTTPSVIAHSGSWLFDLKMDFNPSTSNYSKVYLMSDQSDLQDPQQAFFLSFGGSSSDKISLYKQQGSTSSLVAESNSGLLNFSSVDVRVKVDRSANGLWTVALDSSGVFKTVANGIDSTQMGSSFFGVSCFFTKTRGDKFYFDNFSGSGKALQDTIGPTLDSIKQVYNNRVQLFFNEEVEKMSSEVLINYQLFPNLQNPIYALRDTINTFMVELEFQNELSYGVNYQIEATGIQDKFGNTNSVSDSFMVKNPPPKVEVLNVIDKDTLTLLFKNEIAYNSALDNLNTRIDPQIGFPLRSKRNPDNKRLVELKLNSSLKDSTVYSLIINGIEDTLGYTEIDTLSFTYYKPKFGDVVINELMLDPEPTVGGLANRLPETEYIELYNRSPFEINLKNWTLEIGSKQEALKDYTLSPNSYVLLVSEEADTSFPNSFDILTLPISESALTNSSGSVSLFSSHEELITSVSYTSLWYKDENKQDGGWALEKIDPNWVCEDESNWRASMSEIGGTPGVRNSVFERREDKVKPRLLWVSIENLNHIVLHFSEGLDGEVALNLSHYSFTPNLTLDSVFFSDHQRKNTALIFKENLQESVVYRLTLKNFWQDCFGNTADLDSLIFGIPETPNPGELILNEVLFNPSVGGSDYVELFNLSNKIFDLSKLYLGNMDVVLNQISNVERLQESSRLFFPGEFLVFTEDTAFVRANYTVQNPSWMIEVANLPLMDDDEGSIALSSSNFKLIDQLIYSEDNHASNLDDNEGVSLERIDYNAETNTPENWQSAASTFGYGTPSSENSQKYIPNLNSKFEVDPKVFTPNQDGFEDFITFGYSFSKSNYSVSVKVWNTDGNSLKVLMDNQIVSQEGWVKWDGTDDDGLNLKSGIYIVTLEYLHEDGAQGSIKKVCVLSR